MLEVLSRLIRRMGPNEIQMLGDTHLGIFSGARRCRSTCVALIVIVLCSIAVRLVVHHALYPFIQGDTLTFWAPIVNIINGVNSLSDLRVNGFRTPVYPFFLFLSELLTKGSFDLFISMPAAELVAIVQSALGILSPLLVYYICRYCAISQRIAVFVAILIGVLPQIVVSEMIVLAESVTLSFMIIAIAILSIGFDRLLKRGTFIIGLFCGCVVAIDVLTRPESLVFFFVFVGVLILAGLWQFTRKRRYFLLPIAKFCGAVLLSSSLPVLGWMSVNYHYTGIFWLSPMTGVTRSTTAYNLFDRVEPKDKALGDIMHKYYISSNAEQTKSFDYIWSALPEIRQHLNEMPFVKRPPFGEDIHIRNHLSNYYVDLDDPNFFYYLGGVSQSLLFRNPGVWLSNGLSNFVDTFFDFSVPNTRSLTVLGRSQNLVRHETTWKLLTRTYPPFESIMFYCYLLTWLSLPLTAWRFFVAEDDSEVLKSTFVFGLATSALAFLIAPCFLATYSSRYGKAVYPILIILAAYTLQVACTGLRGVYNSRAPIEWPRWNVS